MWPYLLILLAFAADRLSKWWAADYFATHGPIRVNQYLTIQQTYNEGVAFGLFQGVAPVVGWLTLGIVVGLVVFLRQVPKHEWLVRAGLGILIGGALGNMVDRIIAGRVLDFIETPLRAGVFNVADVMINGGMALIILGSFVHRETREESSPETAVSPTDPPS